jgi:hypothetical protein
MQEAKHCPNIWCGVWPYLLNKLQSAFIQQPAEESPVLMGVQQLQLCKQKQQQGINTRATQLSTTSCSALWHESQHWVYTNTLDYLINQKNVNK